LIRREVEIKLKQNVWIFRALILVFSIFIIAFSISCTAATLKQVATPGEKTVENSQSSENQPGTEKETTTVKVQSSQNESNPTGNTENQNLNESKTTELPVGGLGPGGSGTKQVDGLHLTGTPIKVDIDTYRLKVSGAVKKELSLTFDDVKKMPSERVFSELVCPGFFTDSGYWTGVKIIDILNIAGINENAKTAEFKSLDGYLSDILIDKFSSEGFLIAYEFNDKEFAEENGYPLRVVAKGETGSVWVKWLGEIIVME